MKIFVHMFDYLLRTESQKLHHRVKGNALSEVPYIFLQTAPKNVDTNFYPLKSCVTGPTSRCSHQHHKISII